MPIRSQMSSIMGQIEPEHSELFALEVGKIAEYNFVYNLSSTNIDQSRPNLVRMYVIIKSRTSSIMDLIGPELSELSALELENLTYLTLVMNVIGTELSELSAKYLKKLLHLTLFTFYHLHI